MPFCQLYALGLLVLCIAGVVESSWEGIAGCVVHVDVHAWRVCMLWVDAMYLLLSMAGIVCLACRNCEQCWVCMVCWEFYVML